MGVLILDTPPAVEPVTTAEAKAQARVDISADDTLIGSRITAAREYVERATGRSLVNTTWKLLLEEFPAGPVLLPRPPLSSITHVKYYEPGETTQTEWDHTTKGVVVTPYHQPGVLEPAPDETWPSTETRSDAVEIKYVAGYGSSADDVPEVAKLAILLLVAHWYEERAPVVVGAVSKEVEYTLGVLLQSMGWGRYSGG